MQIKLFTIPITSVDDYDSDINTFLRNNKIIDIEKHLIQTANNVYWCFYISYISKTNNNSSTSFSRRSNGIDYKTVLSASEFEKFEKLRFIRKQISTEDAVAAYVVATDSELASIVKLSEVTLSNLKKIKGFGKKKAEKYGKQIVEKYSNQIVRN